MFDDVRITEVRLYYRTKRHFNLDNLAFSLSGVCIQQSSPPVVFNLASLSLYILYRPRVQFTMAVRSRKKLYRTQTNTHYNNKH